MGDSVSIVQYLTWDVHVNNFYVTYDEIWTHFVHSLAYKFLHVLFDWSVDKAYALVSSLCGIAALMIIIRFWRNNTREFSKQTAGISFCLSMGATQLFFGYLENYSIVVSIILLYILLAQLTLENRLHPAWPALALSTGICFHVLAGWLLPSLLYLWFAGIRLKSTRQNIKDLILITLAIVAPIGSTFIFFFFIGVSPTEIKNTHLWALKFIFLLDESYGGFQYKMFSLSHLGAVINQVMISGLPGVLTIFVLFLKRKRIGIEDKFLQFLIVSVFFLQIFAATWNPDLGAYKDWDLFAVTGIGYTILGSYLFIKNLNNDEVRRWGLVIAAISFTLSGSWVVGNSLAADLHDITYDTTISHNKSHQHLGGMFAEQQKYREATRHYKEAVRIDPKDSISYANLGQTLRMEGKRNEAIENFQKYLTLEPEGEAAELVRQIMENMQKEEREKT